MSGRRFGRLRGPNDRLGLGATPYKDHVLADHPLAYWRLGESSGSLTDSSAAGRMGMTANGSGFTYSSSPAKGVDGASIAFTGAGGFYNSFCGILGWANTFSVEAFLKFTSTSQMTYFCVDQVATGLQNGRQMWLRVSSGKVDFNVYCGGSSGGQYAVLSAGTVNDGNWHHVVCTYVGNSMVVYVDGAQSNTGSSVGTLNNNQNGTTAPYMTIGANNNNSPANFGQWSGSIDEVAVFDYALSADRIAERYALLGP